MMFKELVTENEYLVSGFCLCGNGHEGKKIGQLSSEVASLHLRNVDNVFRQNHGNTDVNKE
jgi:hypothetical protein